MSLNNLARGNEKVYYSNTMTLVKDPSSTDDSSTWRYAVVPNVTLSNPKYDLKNLSKDKFFPVEQFYNYFGGNASPGMFGAQTQTTTTSPQFKPVEEVIKGLGKDDADIIPVLKNTYKGFTFENYSNFSNSIEVTNTSSGESKVFKTKNKNFAFELQKFLKPSL